MPFEKVSCRKKLDSLNLCAQGNNAKGVAQEIGISESTIYRSKRNLRTCGDVEGKKVKRGRKPKITPQTIDVFFSFMPELIDSCCFRW